MVNAWEEEKKTGRLIEWHVTIQIKRSTPQSISCPHNEEDQTIMEKIDAIVLIYMALVQIVYNLLRVHKPINPKQTLQNLGILLPRTSFLLPELQQSILYEVPHHVLWYSLRPGKSTYLCLP